jgi:hypothetical protein
MEVAYIFLALAGLGLAVRMSLAEERRCQAEMAEYLARLNRFRKKARRRPL